jgi:hypothetical protein
MGIPDTQSVIHATPPGSCIFFFVYKNIPVMLQNSLNSLTGGESAADAGWTGNGRTLHCKFISAKVELPSAEPSPRADIEALREFWGGPSKVGPKTIDRFEACIWFRCDRSVTLVSGE